MYIKLKSAVSFVSLICLLPSLFFVCHAADIEDAELLFEKRQYAQARSEFEKFAKHGHAKAQYYLGIMYYQGKGGPADIYQAYAWFSLSDENGFRAAGEEIRRMRREIPSKRQAKEVAESLAQRYSNAALARKLYPDYDGSLGTMPPVSVKPLKAVPADSSGFVLLQGDINEQGQLFNVAVVQALPNNKFEKSAIEYALSQEYTPLIDNNELLINENVLVKVEFRAQSESKHRTYHKLLDTYHRSLLAKAENHDVEAQIALAQLMSSGIVKSHSSEVSAVPVYWYLQAAINGNASAKYQLSKHLELGVGCLANQQKATYWLEQSAYQGYPSAQFELTRQRLANKPSKRQLRKLVNTLEQLVEDDHKNAHQTLALIYATSKYDDFYFPFKAGLMAKDGLYEDPNNPDYHAILAASYLGQTSVDRAYEYFYLALNHAIERNVPLKPYVELANALEITLDTRGLELDEAAENELKNTQLVFTKKDLKPLSRPFPEYPVDAMRDAVEGWVRVNFTVNEEGKVEDVKIVSASPEQVFDESTRRAVAKWRYQPPKVNSQPTRIENVSVKLDFTIK
ncbi:TonB family protein [Catenovulum agarivorans DS-2]|uniref:Protein TonB n=1 Tax=Catenovulum agarivorans DS-2 TaxID=1328313 RepID=W7QGH2_9ALTE|nr:TonB family protein [Catenovulum agarivorans]EWH11011.1 TonB family protein [Catenovulum agarivorans DS-2]